MLSEIFPIASCWALSPVMAVVRLLNKLMGCLQGRNVSSRAYRSPHARDFFLLNQLFASKDRSSDGGRPADSAGPRRARRVDLAVRDASDSGYGRRQRHTHMGISLCPS